MKYLLRGLALAVLGFALSSCSNTTGSLLSSSTSDLTSYDVSTTPIQAELMVSSYSQSYTDFYCTVASANCTSVGMYMDRVDISGTCYASTYASNGIYVYINAINGTRATYTDLSGVTNTHSGAASCYQGRYHIAIYTGALAVGNTNFYVQIVGYDSTGAAYTNASQGQTLIAITK